MSKYELFNILNIDSNSNVEDVKKAYKKLALKYHPDINNNDPNKFIEITEAYNKIINYLTSDQCSEVKCDEYSQDIYVKLELSLEEIVFGCEKQVSFKTESQCKSCNNTGMNDQSPKWPCLKCNGTGKQVTMWGVEFRERICNKCNGEGSMYVGVCNECNGKKRSPKHFSFKVKIPQGVGEGQEIRVKVANEEMGHVFIKIHSKPHNTFKRINDDLIASYEINAFEAILGCTKKIKLINDDDIEILFHSGIQQNECVIVKGLGIKNINTGSVGDLKIKTHISTPKNLSKESMETVKDLLNKYVNLK